MAALIARLDVERVNWIGISLGGLIGMRLAEQPNSPIGRLVLVDIGGYIGKPALERIAGVVSRSPSFPNLAALEAYLREVSAPYGPLTDEQWGHIARYGSRQDAAGAWRLHYDPGIAEPFREGFAEPVDLWSLWQVVSCPVLVLRGKDSDVLLEGTAERMRVLKPSMQLIEFAGVGHPPMLLDEQQTRPVREWLLS